MRVLHVHSGNIFGGIETALVTIAHGHQPRVDGELHAALCYRGRLADALTRAGASVSILGEVQLRHPRSVRRARTALVALLERIHPDVVVTHLPWTQVLFAGTVRRLGYPLIAWMHGPSAGWLSRAAALHRPDAILCNSDFTASTIPKAHRTIPRAIVRYPSAPPVPEARAARASTRRALGADAAQVVIAQVSRLDRWKGHDIHVRAAGRLRDLEGWVLWFVGGPQRGAEVAYEKSLRDLAASLGIGDRVKFLGQREDVPYVLAAADVYCQPNTEPEPFGLAYVEALAAGLPAIGSAFGGASEILTPDTGILVPPGDVEAVARALRRLILDPAERSRLGTNGPARAVELCDPARQLGRVRDFLADAISRRQTVSC